MGAVLNLMQNQRDTHTDPTALVSSRTGTSPYREDDTQRNEDRGEVNPILENQSERDSGIWEEIISGEMEANPLPLCLGYRDVDMEKCNNLMETPNVDGIQQ